MKRVEAVITPWTLDEFKEAALELKILEFNSVEVQHSSSVTVARETRLHRGREYTVDLLPRLKLEFVLFDDDVRATLEKLAELVHPEIIAVFKLEQIIPIAESNLSSDPSLGRAVSRSTEAVLRQIGGSDPRKSAKDHTYSSAISSETIAAGEIKKTG
jgi:nitrogen regulatory protein PII